MRTKRRFLSPYILRILILCYFSGLNPSNAMRILFSLLLIMIISSTSAQQVELLTSGTRSSFRGLSAVDDNIVWVSGSNGTVGKSINGGKTWEWITVPGYEKREFRDIEAFDEKTAVVIAIAEPANILKTTDGGKTWKQV